MKRKLIALISLLFIGLFFWNCKPEKITASSDWNGNWKLNEELIFPQTKSTIGTIRIDPNDDNKIIISGELFGLYSSNSISALVSSNTASFNQKIGIYQLEGKAQLDGKNRIFFQIRIRTENSTEDYTRTAIRI